MSAPPSHPQPVVCRRLPEPPLHHRFSATAAFPPPPLSRPAQAGMGEPEPPSQGAAAGESKGQNALVDVYTMAVEQLRDGTFQYLFQVLWSDGTMGSARQTFDALYATHCSLLDLYPEEAGVLDAPRVIPPFPGKKVVTGLTKSGRAANAHALAQKRLREIAAYMTGMARLPTIKDSREFVRLFDNHAADRKSVV